MIKDYYAILEVEPVATTAEIKAAYRKLAHLYHPDKNPGNKYAISQFYLVKEAYEILSAPVLREQYLYDRSLAKANAIKMETAAINPERIVQNLIEVNKRVQTYDAFRMNKEALTKDILILLSTENVAMLNDFNDATINDEIIKQALRLNNFLPLDSQQLILSELKKIKMSVSSLQQISLAEKNRQQQQLIEKYQPWLIVFAVVLLCILIYLSGAD